MFGSASLVLGVGGDELLDAGARVHVLDRVEERALGAADQDLRVDRPGLHLCLPIYVFQDIDRKT